MHLSCCMSTFPEKTATATVLIALSDGEEITKTAMVHDCQGWTTVVRVSGGDGHRRSNNLVSAMGNGGEDGGQCSMKAGGCHRGVGQEDVCVGCGDGGRCTVVLDGQDEEVVTVVFDGEDDAR
ncbi:hypothetical protein M8C21_027079 [Ambrosia artemisiifolia]|uniref:Uncharacterized protein n=1 Tax=Ambrosia artemisiifolia TaxID=4212 RepID=A0AAD5GMD3_AMBAR|nr:hypothetical protein M8C21_027079 [Ambrosia artemisiifolia]